MFGASGPAAVYESIATASGNGTSQSITFSNIPQTYTHLEIRGIGQAATSTNDYGYNGVRFNGDTGTNYTRHGLFGTNNSTYAYAVTGANFADIGNASYLNTSAASTVGVTIVSILDYTNTNKYKTVRALAGTDLNGLAAVGLHSGLWLNTAAVTSITVYQSNGNFTNKSTYALYGIKGA